MLAVLASLPAAAGTDAEVQLYPAGVITTVGYSKPCGDAGMLRFHAGYNRTDRQDFGEHDDETGDGLGAGLRYAVRLGAAPRHGWVIGGRVDLWRLKIDWRDGNGAAARRGQTDITVLQPTALAGYQWPIGTRGRIELSAAAGAEINVQTDGQDVGEGAIGLIGLRIGF